MKKIALLIILCFAGCNKQEAVKSEPLSPDAVKISKFLESSDKDTRKVVYFLFSGIADYVERYEGLTNTKEALALFSTVGKRYGLKSEVFDKMDDGTGENDCNDVIERRLKAEGFETKKTFDKDVRLKFVAIFREFESGALDSINKK